MSKKPRLTVLINNNEQYIANNSSYHNTGIIRTNNNALKYFNKYIKEPSLVAKGIDILFNILTLNTEKNRNDNGGSSLFSRVSTKENTEKNRNDNGGSSLFSRTHVKENTLTNIIKKYQILTHRKKIIDSYNKTNKQIEIIYDIILCKKSNRIYKIYKFNNYNKNLKNKIIKEIVLQKYIFELSGRNFIVPKIYNYKIFNIDEYPYNTMLVIEMDFIPYDNLKDFLIKNPQVMENNILKKKLLDEVNGLITFMNSNNLYHNDLNHGNILVSFNDNNSNFVVAIIDFGESVYNNSTNTKNIKYNNNMLNRLIGKKESKKRHLNNNYFPI